MNEQLKRGLLDMCVLRAIRYEESYGYKIIKDIKPHIEIKECTLYPILRRLEEHGLITERNALYNGRIRKYYHITSSGIESIEGFKEDWEVLSKIYDYIIEEEK